MMKMVVGYIEREAFEPIREELLDLGFLSISSTEASGSVPEATVAGQYRGVAIERHSRPKARLECVVGADHVPVVTETVLKHAPEKSFLFVVAVEHAYPTETVKLDTSGVA
jgi:nitrogen regulatory protein PII